MKQAKRDGAAEHGVLAYYFMQGGLGRPLRQLYEQEPEESEGVSHVAGGGAFQNKSHEAGECILCSRKSKDRCCWQGKVVKDVRACGEPDQAQCSRAR